MEMSFNIEEVRANFPQIRSDHAFFDNAAGTFTPLQTIRAITDHLMYYGSVNAGPHAEGTAMADLKTQARSATALFLNAQSDEVIFGPSSTAMTFRLSTAFANIWGENDEIIVTELEHESDISPWRDLEKIGVRIKVWPARLPLMTLHIEDLLPLLNQHTRLLAITASSNVLGVITPVKEAIAAAHAVGAWTFVDNVHGAAHHLPDVQDWNTDFMTFSPYKILAPHLGVLYVRSGLLEHLPSPKLSFMSNDSFNKLEYGTAPFSSLAGWLGALSYLTNLGKGSKLSRTALTYAYQQMDAQERILKHRFINGLKQIPQVTLYGPQEAEGRAGTFALRVNGYTPLEISEKLRDLGISVTAGHVYAIQPMTKLGLMPDGVVRVSFAHYNTTDEVDRLLDGLGSII
jgi:cysteine desulfurase family protein (TIGR01976 family)